MSKALAVILFVIHFAHAFAGTHGASSIISKIQRENSKASANLSSTASEKLPTSNDNNECEHDYELTDSGADEEIYHRSFLQICSEIYSEASSINYTLSHCMLIELPEQELNTPPPEHFHHC